MSRPSQKALMREALQITEGNLTSLLCSRDNLGLTTDNTVIGKALHSWRDVVRKALGSYRPHESELLSEVSA